MKRWQVIGSALFLSLVVILSLTAVAPRQEPCGDYLASVMYHRDSGKLTPGAWGTIEDWALGGRRQYGNVAGEEFQVGADLRFWPDSVEMVFYGAPGWSELDRHVLRRSPDQCVYSEELDDMPGFTLLFLPVSSEQTARWPALRVQRWR